MEKTSWFTTHKELLVRIAEGTMVVVLIVVLFYLANQKNGITPNLLPKPTPTPYPKPYSDSSHSFMLKYPSNWSVTESVITGKTGIGTAHEKTQKIEVTSFYYIDSNKDPLSRIGVTIHVDRQPPSCTDPTYHKPNTTLAHLPVYYDASRHIHMLFTTNATYMIAYSYPGIPGFRYPRNYIPPSSIPHSLIVADQKRIDALLASFIPTNVQSLRCL